MTEKTARIYFHGVWSAGRAGHHLYTPTGYGHASELPWPKRDLDGGLLWNAGAWIERGTNRWREPSTSAEVQGEAALRHKAGWTALAWWDFTGDRRGGSNSVVMVDQVRTFDEMLALFAMHFPAQAARQTGLMLMRSFDDGGGDAGT